MDKITIYEQEKNYTCGPAALRSVLSYFNIVKSEDELAVLCEADSERGTKPHDLSRVLELLGLNVKFGEGEDAEKSLAHLNYWVNEKKIPVIVDWFSQGETSWNGHYSIVLDLTKEFVTLGDPEFSDTDRRTRKVKLGDFMRAWLDWDSDILEDTKDLHLRFWLVGYK